MLQESKTNELEYQRLSKEEMDQRGILGRLVGVCADIISPTRNGRKYPEKLWENVFNDPIMKERIENGVCYGELGHPADREETDMEKIAVCLAEQPKKGKDGKLRAVFDILNTPNGRILKSLCDYGSTLGISSRGSGDLETDFDGQESVNPDTYNCEGFDVVLIPAVKEARLQYVTEALDKKRYNKTLREKLTESIKKETEEHQKVINESLSTLGVTLDESQYNDYEVQNTESGTILRDSKGDFVQEFPTDDEATEWINDKELDESTHLSKDWKTLNIGDDVQWTSHDFDGDTTWDCVVKEVYDDHIIISPKDDKYSDMNLWVCDELDESLSLYEANLTPEEKMYLWHNGQRKENIKACGDAKLYKYREICKNNNYVKEVTVIDAELQNRGLTVPEQSSQVVPKKENTKPTCKMQDNELYILFDNAGKEFISKYTNIGNIPRALVRGNEYFIIKQSDSFANELANDLIQILNEDLIVSQIKESFINLNDSNIQSVAAENDGAMMKNFQQLLSANQELQEKIVSLQEKLSVSYAKEMSLNEELSDYKEKISKLSETANNNIALNEQLTSIKSSEQLLTTKCKKLTESIDRKNVKLQQIAEQYTKQKEQIQKLQEQLKTATTSLIEKENIISDMNNQYDVLNENYQQMKDNYSKKIESQNNLVEKYRNIAVKSVNKYIDTQATRLGVKPSEIKNRLPESYSFKDIDDVCNDLQEYNLNISTLPFNTGNKLEEGLKFKAQNVDNRVLIHTEEDLDDLTLRLAGL